MRLRPVAGVVLFVLGWGAGAARGGERVELVLDATEAEAVLAILERSAAGETIGEQHWRRLFESEPWRRLERRETSLGRPFAAESFRRFVLAPELGGRAGELRRTLEAWRHADLDAAAARVLPYLPATARIQVRVYPVIKPQSNSFVYEVATDPAIFLYLDPEMSEAEFANTVAHELHHIGLASAASAHEGLLAPLPAPARQAAGWMGAFGEGLAMLAAAGSPDAPPLGAFPADDQVRWAQDFETVDQQLRQLDQFFLDLVQGGFTRPEVADHVAFTFFGYRGPWYTVGYRMGTLVERRFGRATLLACMVDPRLLLRRYNEAAAEHNAAGESLATWSPALLAAVGAGAPTAPSPVTP